MADNVEKLKVFDTKRKQELLCDLKRICYEHDIDFRFQIGFTMANYRMAKKVYKLFHWVPLIKREIIYMIIFILLMKYAFLQYDRLRLRMISPQRTRRSQRVFFLN